MSVCCIGKHQGDGHRMGPAGGYEQMPQPMEQLRGVLAAMSKCHSQRNRIEFEHNPDWGVSPFFEKRRRKFEPQSMLGEKIRTVVIWRCDRGARGTRLQACWSVTSAADTRTLHDSDRRTV